LQLRPSARSGTMSQTHAAAMSTTTSTSTPERAPAHGHLYIHASGRPAEVHFQFEQQEKRLGGALGASVISHGAFVLLILLIMRLAPQAGEHAMLIDRTPHEIVWLAEPGLGGGGGGGGNQQKEPIKKAELPGKEKLTVPVEKKPDPVVIEQPKEEEQKINIPAVTMSASDEVSPGLIESKEDTTSQGIGSNGGAGTGSGTGIGNGQGSGLGEGSGGGTGGGVYRPGNGVESPRLLRSVRPNYTAEAMRAKVQGVVRLEGVVLSDGTVGDVRVTRSLDSVFGLDQEAMKAAKQFRFIPGTRFGEPVSVLVSFEIEFTLR